MVWAGSCGKIDVASGLFQRVRIGAPLHFLARLFSRCGFVGRGQVDRSTLLASFLQFARIVPECPRTHNRFGTPRTMTNLFREAAIRVLAYALRR